MDSIYVCIYPTVFTEQMSNDFFFILVLLFIFAPGLLLHCSCTLTPLLFFYCSCVKN